MTDTLSSLLKPISPVIAAAVEGVTTVVDIVDSTVEAETKENIYQMMIYQNLKIQLPLDRDRV